MKKSFKVLKKVSIVIGKIILAILLLAFFVILGLSNSIVFVKV